MKKLLIFALLFVSMTSVLVGCGKESAEPNPLTDSTEEGDSANKDEKEEDKEEDKDVSFISPSDMEALGFELIFEDDDFFEYENEAGDYVIFNANGSLSGALNADETVQIYEIVKEGLVNDTVVNYAIDIFESTESLLPYYSIDNDNMELTFDSEGYVVDERKFTDDKAKENAGTYAGVTFDEIAKMHFEYLIAK